MVVVKILVLGMLLATGCTYPDDVQRDANLLLESNVTPATGTPSHATASASDAGRETPVPPVPPVTAVALQPSGEPVAATLSPTLSAIPTLRHSSASLQESPPTPAAAGTVTYYEREITLPTYPYEEYQTDAVDPATRWPYKKFDRERFLAENPSPQERTWRVLILENAYLRLTILPELGGRLWQAEHKASGNRMFYQNSVIKPSPWGPSNQLGWFALGGLEWNLPVIEHGYEWGTPWGVLPLQHDDALAAVTLFTPQDGRLLHASITISLRAGAASFEIEPTLTNVGERDLPFDYWHTAMLAPGPGNSPSADLHFVLPSRQMSIHSTGDPTLPQPGQPFSWPIYRGRDLSRLGVWNQYLGFFEYPAAHGPFAGVYDRQYDAGAVRVYPADVAQGSKVFSPGWLDTLASEQYTDDGSTYVELHGGLARTFSEQYRLPTGRSVTWREVWYPIQDIGDLTVANEVAAMHLEPSSEGLRTGFYPTRPMHGTLVVSSQGVDLARTAVRAQPNAPFRGLIVAPDLMYAEAIQVRFEDAAGNTLLQYALPD